MSVKKVVRNIILLVISFIVLLVVLAEVFKNQVVGMVLEHSAKSFNLPLTVGDVDLSLIRKFPLATIEFNNVLLLDSEKEHAKDTIIAVKKLYASVDVRKLMDGNVFVKKIELDNAQVNYHVDSIGNSNIDFILDAMSDSTQEELPDTSKLQGMYSLKDLLLEHVHVNYSDATLKLATTLTLPKIDVKGELNDNGYRAAIKGDVILNSVAFDNFRLNNLKNSILDVDLSAFNDTINFKKIQLDAPGNKASLYGQFVNAEKPYLDLSCRGKISSLKQVLAFLPQEDIDKYKIHHVDGNITFDSKMKGVLTDSILPHIDANYQVGDLSIKYDTYPLVKNVSLEGTFSNGSEASNATTHIYISNFSAESRNSKFTASGDIKNLDHILYNLSLGADVELNDWISFVPENMVKQMSGRINAVVNTSGVVPDSITDDFIEYTLKETDLTAKIDDVSFKMDSVDEVKELSGNINCADGRVLVSKLKAKLPAYKLNLTDGLFTTHYKGSVNDVDNMTFRVDTFNLQIEHNNNLSGVAYLESLNTGKYKIRVHTSLNLKDIKPLIPDTLLTDMSGCVKANFHSQGQFNIDSIANQAMDLLLGQSQFNIETDKLTIALPDTIVSIDNLSANVSYGDDVLLIKHSSGTYKNIDFAVDSASITNIYAGFIQNKVKTIMVKGNYNFGNIDYALFEPFIDDTTVTETTAAEPQKWTYEFRGKVGARSLKYGKALFKNISSKVLVKPDYYVADQFKVNAFGGDMIASMKYKYLKDKRSVVWTKTDLKNMDIHRLLVAFDDFKDFYDPAITSDQLKGVFSTKMDMRLVLNKDLEPYMDSLLLTGNMTLEDGALINVPAVKDLETIPFVGLKNMNNLRFQTMKSSLFIYNNKVYIPKTEIRSSSFEASFLGMYNFNEDYDFHVRILLGQIMSGKVKNDVKKKKKDGGFGEDEKGTYLVSSYLNGKSKAWFDNKKDRSKMSTIIGLNKIGISVLFNPKLIGYDTEKK